MDKARIGRSGDRRARRRLSRAASTFILLAAHCSTSATHHPALCQAWLSPRQVSRSTAATRIIGLRRSPRTRFRAIQEEWIQGDGNLVEESFQDRYKEVLPAWLLDKCVACGWERPTRIQKEALDTILFDKRDAIIQAETGSGKTLSYLLPALASIDGSRAAVQALIIVPTRELGMQVARIAKRLAAASTEKPSEGALEGSSPNSNRIMVMSVLQGSQNRRQRAWAWAEPPHLVIGTPQELCDMVKYGGIKRYNSIKYVVVDEVDACLLNNAGSLSSNLSSSTLHELLSKVLSPTFDDGSSLEEMELMVSSNKNSRTVSQQRQTVFASATIPQHRHFLKQCIQNQWTLRDPIHVSLRKGEQLMPLTLEHAYVVCTSPEKKLAALRRLLQKIYAVSIESAPKKVLVFVEPHRFMEEMADALAGTVEGGLSWKESFGPQDEEGVAAIFAVLRYEDSLSKRASSIDSFRAQHSPKAYGASAGSSPQTTSQVDATKQPSLRVLFSTDMAGRGLDIPDVTHVIHYDLPPDADTYVHRSGRTGRFGRSGQVLSIITEEQEFVLRRLTNKLSVEAKCVARQQSRKQN